MKGLRHIVRKRNKYGVGIDPQSKAERTVDGILFASQKEAERYCELKLLQQAGAIKNLELQPKFSLDVNGVHICDYIADFRYADTRSRRVIVEDTKGYKTKEYKIKKALMLAVHQIEILET